MKHIKNRNHLKIITIFILIFAGLNVYAGTKDGSLVRNQIDGIYAVAPLSDRVHLYNLEIDKINGKTTYCIEIGKKITTNLYNSTTDSNEQMNITNLTEEQLNYIKAVSYFGYDYPNHNDIKYYMAAQELIWEYINNIDITWTNELDINAPKIDIESYKQEIKNQVERYITPLSIPKIVTYKIGTTNVITDNNNSIPFYEAKSEKNQEVAIKNNQLEIKIGPINIRNDVITLTRKKQYTEKSTIYHFDSSQTMISTGNLDEVTHNINIVIKGAKLNIQLIDKDKGIYEPSGQASLENPKYEIYDKDNTFHATIEIPYPGKTSYINLSYGTYYIKHLEPSIGYQLNNKIEEIIIEKPETTITLEEEVIKSQIEINKLYETTSGNIKEKGIKFEIYDNNNQLYETITTTDVGPDITILPYGIYTMKQINTTTGYKKVEDIKINIKDMDKTYIKYNLLDEKIKIPINIITKDKTNNKDIIEKNITYKILNKETNKYIEYIDEFNQKKTEFQTNENGLLDKVITLPYGKYSLEQITPPKKYLENNKVINFTINDKITLNYLNDELTYIIDFYNEPITGKINITTTKEETNIKNNTIDKKNTIRPNTEIELYKDDILINTYETNKSGNLTIKDLELGKYCLKDLETKEKQCIELINEDNKTKVIEKAVSFIKKLETTTLIIKNIDEKNNPIVQSQFEITINGKIIKKETSKDGTITISNLPIGSYCIKQTKVSNKYTINKENICFKIEDISKEKEVTVINKIKKSTIKVPNTLNNTNPNNNLSKIVIMGIIFLLMLIKKEIKSN